MTDLAFEVLDVTPDRFAATPTLTTRLHIVETGGEAVHAVALRCQIRIEPQRRPYDDAEATRVRDVFGARDRWKDTLRPFLWTHASAMVPSFTAETEVDLPLNCSYDFDVAAAKYLHALRDGVIPLEFMFSGTVFTRGTSGFQIEQIPWHKDVAFAMPASRWHAVMDLHFPGAGWIRASRDTIDALGEYKSRYGLLDWDDTLAALLRKADDQATVEP